jgi:type VI secretion system protein ImpH
MASPGRRSARHLSEEIRSDGPRFGFFQAVRLLALEVGAGSRKAAVPDTIRFGAPLSLTFPASEIAAIVAAPPVPVADTPPNDDMAAPAPAENTVVPLEMTVGFMGMTGPSGALPVSYTELFIDRRNQFRDNTGHQFLDLFTHRAVSLFYQAWHKHRFYLSHEAGDGEGFSRNLLDLVGVGLRNLQQRLDASGAGIPDRFLIHYAGLFAQKPLSAANIAALVEGYFDIPAQLEQFVGQWLHLPTAERSTLGGPSACLGRNGFVGGRLWDRQNKLRLKLGPMRHARFAEFMPGQAGRAALQELIRFCVGFTLDCDVELCLDRRDIPPSRLDAASAPRLGCNLWLNAGPAPSNADDMRFALLDGCPA